MVLMEWMEFIIFLSYIVLGLVHQVTESILFVRAGMTILVMELQAVNFNELSPIVNCS